MATLYVETNFVLGIARGQDVDASRITAVVSQHRLAMPAVCVMEAMSAFQRLRSEHHRFRNDDLGRWVRELGRDRTSVAAAAMLGHIEQARIEADRLIDDVRHRLVSTLDALVREAVLIPADSAVVAEALRVRHLEQMTDNLIFHSIVADGRGRFGPKALLTGNVRDFAEPAVVALLRSAGIDGPHATAADALRWLAAN